MFYQGLWLVLLIKQQVFKESVDGNIKRLFCFKTINISRMNWTDARDDCMSRGGNLLSISNIQQQAYLTVNRYIKVCKTLALLIEIIFIFQLQSHLVNFTSDPMWIGLNDVISEGRFYWRDGTPFVYTNWRQGEPNSPGFRSRGLNVKLVI